MILSLFLSINSFAKIDSERFIEMNNIKNFHYNEENKFGLIEFINLNIEAINKKDLRFFYKNKKITELLIYPEKALFPKKENETATVSYQDILQETDIGKSVYVIYSSFLRKNKKNRWNMANISISSFPPTPINSFTKNDFKKLGITGEMPFKVDFHKHTKKKRVSSEIKVKDTQFAKYETKVKYGKETLSLEFTVGKNEYNPNDKYPYRWNTLIIKKVE